MSGGREGGEEGGEDGVSGKEGRMYKWKEGG